MNDTALIDEARVNLGIAKANLNLGRCNSVKKIVNKQYIFIYM